MARSLRGVARVEPAIACLEQQWACGQATRLIGYEESEQLEVEPAKVLCAGDEA